ncbi:MAG: acyltransferase, partial [Cyanobacteria bacterium P01_D01_bin.36]
MASSFITGNTDSASNLVTETPQVKPSSSHTGYRPEIDGLRAIAVIAVIINHFNASSLPSGFLGVDIFFVISGFVVTSSLSRKSGLSWKDYLLTFYSRRIKRLIPALVVCVLITAVIGCLFVEDPRTSLRTGLASLIGASNLYLLKESTDYFGQSGELNLFTQTWSLGVEEQFYLVFPILLGLCGFSRMQRRNGRRNLFFVVLTLSVLSLVGYVHLNYQLRFSSAFFLMPARFWELGAGCLIFLMAKRISALPRFKVLLAPVSAAGLIGLLFFSPSFQMFATLATVFFTSTLLWSFRENGRLVSLFSQSWMVQIGLLSYSLYLWHWSVLVLSRWTVGISKWTVPVQLLLILGLAIASNRWIEKPLRYAKWSTGQLQTIGYGFAATFTSAVVLVGLAVPLKGKLFLSTPYAERSQRTFKLSNQFKPCKDARSIADDFA